MKEKLDSVLRCRDIILLTKVCIFKAMIFPVVMYSCESWTIKQAECQRMDAFKLWCWWRLFRVSWTAKRSNQSILKEINTEYSLEGLMLKLKLQYFGHLMRRAYSSVRTLMLGKIGGRRRRGWQRMRWLDGITDLMDMSLSQLWEMVMDREAWLQSMGSQKVRHDWVTELTNWTVSPNQWSLECKNFSVGSFIEGMVTHTFTAVIICWVLYYIPSSLMLNPHNSPMEGGTIIKPVL